MFSAGRDDKNRLQREFRETYHRVSIGGKVRHMDQSDNWAFCCVAMVAAMEKRDGNRVSKLQDFRDLWVFSVQH